MARIHGRKGRVYMAVASGAEAAPLPFFAKWSINFATDKSDVTAMGDDNHVYVTGLPDAKGNFSGFYDDATNQTYTAAVDGVARKFYLYPSILTNTQYFWGTILPDINIDSDVAGPVTVAADWVAASTVTKTG